MGPHETESPRDGAVPLFLDNANPSARVLVVDNDLHLRALITRCFTKAALRVDTVTDGAEVWDALQTNNNHDLSMTV